MPLIPIITALIPFFTGRKEEKLVGGIKTFEKVSKGLLGSKTAWNATGSAGIIAAIQMLPVDGDMKAWITFGALAIQWLASLYFRAVTKEKI